MQIFFRTVLETVMDFLFHDLPEHRTFHLMNAKNRIEEASNACKSSKETLHPYMEMLYATHPLQSKYFHTTYKRIKHVVLRFANTFVWNENVYKQNAFFVCMTKVYTDKTASTLKTNLIVAYPVCIVFQNFSLQFFRYLIIQARLCRSAPTV